MNDLIINCSGIFSFNKSSTDKSYDEIMDYSYNQISNLIGGQIVNVRNNPDADEGLIFTIRQTNGKVVQVDIGFSGHEGTIEINHQV